MTPVLRALLAAGGTRILTGPTNTTATPTTEVAGVALRMPQAVSYFVAAGGAVPSSSRTGR